MPRTTVVKAMTDLVKDVDYIRTHVTPLKEYDEDYQVECVCLERGEFSKNSFNFFKPMTVWDKKRIYKDYGVRL
jgi:hypothetical protein